MIRVEQKPEPLTFDQEVRQPGLKFLRDCPSPNGVQFKKKEYWKKSAAELHSAYGGVCAFTCMYVMPPASTDHFLPKSLHPGQAYEWSNFRLAAPRVNGFKDNSIQVVDPFVVEPGWFVLDFPSCLVKPGAELSALKKSQVKNSITILRLNDEHFVQERANIMLMTALGKVGLGFLDERYPFLAIEIARQNIAERLHLIFKMRNN
ncbi:hypothetical protein [Undibacterium sp.]|uniref:hypothetical protein n=1 Tax=Undibacterium sp. TaxID=1914977 RepID=UPI00375395A2